MENFGQFCLYKFSLFQSMQIHSLHTTGEKEKYLEEEIEKTPINICYLKGFTSYPTTDYSVKVFLLSYK